jgi:hypothetical protein
MIISRPVHRPLQRRRQMGTHAAENTRGGGTHDGEVTRRSQNQSPGQDAQIAPPAPPCHTLLGNHRSEALRPAAERPPRAPPQRAHTRFGLTRGGHAPSSRAPGGGPRGRSAARVTHVAEGWDGPVQLMLLPSPAPASPADGLSLCSHWLATVFRSSDSASLRCCVTTASFVGQVYCC